MFCTSMGTGPGRCGRRSGAFCRSGVGPRTHYFLIEPRRPLDTMWPKSSPGPSQRYDIRCRAACVPTRRPRWDGICRRAESKNRSLRQPNIRTGTTSLRAVCRAPTARWSAQPVLQHRRRCHRPEGDHSERWRRWDSCFHEDFSYLHGGSVRHSVKSRYRQWMTHKLSTWIDQFGQSGCVGCGRCITFCPVGIDITAGVLALKPFVTMKKTNLSLSPQTLALPFFVGFSEDDLAILADHCRPKPRSGQHRSRSAGPGCDRIFRCSMENWFKPMSRSGAVVLQTLHRGDVLGWSWLLTPNASFCLFGATLTDVGAFRLSTAGTLETCDSHPRHRLSADATVCPGDERSAASHPSSAFRPYAPPPNQRFFSGAKNDDLARRRCSDGGRDSGVGSDAVSGFALSVVRRTIPLR